MEESVNLALDRIYHQKEISILISKNDIRKLLLLCTKNVLFCCGGDIYQQNDVVAIDSLLGPGLAGIFMVELETIIIPTVTYNIYHWRRYVDDIFLFIRKGYLDHVSARLNSFYENIQFTYQLKNPFQNKLPFLDILLIWRGNKIETTVYRKGTNNDIYLNWGSYAPVIWKRGPLKILFNKPYIGCSTGYQFKKKIEHLRYVF